MKRLLSLLVLLAFVAGVRAQLLWKISGGGLAEPSYVVGTFHLAPGTYVDSIGGLRQVLDACPQVYGELSLQEQADPAKLQALQAAMTMPADTTLASLLTADELTRLNATLQQLLGFDLSTPMVGQQLSALKPAALTTQLQLLLHVRQNPTLDVQNLLDPYLLSHATQAGKLVGGLETMAQQAALLYTRTPLQRQAQLLMCLADNLEWNEAMAQRLAAAYYAQSLEAILEVMNEKMGSSCDATAQEEEALIYGRNAQWARQMPTIMHTAPTLFAVGAAHLPGERGLLQLLREAGFSVEPASQPTH